MNCRTLSHHRIKRKAPDRQEEPILCYGVQGPFQRLTPCQAEPRGYGVQLRYHKAGQIQGDFGTKGKTLIISTVHTLGHSASTHTILHTFALPLTPHHNPAFSPIKTELPIQMKFLPLAQNEETDSPRQCIQCHPPIYSSNAVPMSLTIL